MQASLAPQDEAPDQSAPPGSWGASRPSPSRTPPALPASGAILPSTVNILLALLLSTSADARLPGESSPPFSGGMGISTPFPSPRGVWGGGGAGEKGEGGHESSLWPSLLVGSVCHRGMLPEQFGFQGNSVKVCGLRLLPAPSERETHVTRSPGAHGSPANDCRSAGPNPEAGLERAGQGRPPCWTGPGWASGAEERGAGPRGEDQSPQRGQQPAPHAHPRPPTAAGWRSQAVGRPLSTANYFP